MSLLDLSQAIAGLGATGILALLFLLWVSGRLHSSQEKDEWTAGLQYREQLRQEAVADRKAADERLIKMSETQDESNDIMRRSLDLNERLVADFLSKQTDRGRSRDA